MKDSINHALLALGELERNIAHISICGNETQQGLASDCAEHRIQIANRLAQIKQLEPEKEAPGSFAAYVDHHAEKFTPRKLGNATVIPATPEQSADFVRISELIAQTNSAESRDRYEASAKAGDFNGDDINPVSDKAYHADLIRKENVEMWRAYDRRKNWLGCGLACIAAGAILAGIKIWFTYFNL